MFATNRVSSILGEAREVMKEELHYTQQVDEAQYLEDDEFVNMCREKLRMHTEMKVRELNM